MGLGKLLSRADDGDHTRSTVITSTNTLSGETQTFTVVDGIAPDWASSDAYRGAMSIPGAWRAATLLSDLLGEVPYEAYRQPVGEFEELIVPTPMLLEQPNPPDTNMTTFSSWGLDYLWHGNAIGIYTGRLATGYPTACVPVAADQVQVRRVPFNDPEGSPLPPGVIEYAIGDLRLSKQDIFHVKGPCRPGALRGMGVLENHYYTLELARKLQRQSGSIAESGVPTGIIKSKDPTMTKPEAQDLKAEWMTAQRTRTVAVLNDMTEWESVSWNPSELQLVESRKLSNGELELIFGLPLGWLGGFQSTKQYSNVESDAVNLLKFSVQGPLTRFEQELSLAHPRGTKVRATLDVVLRPDQKSRFEAWNRALDPTKGWMERNEVRAAERLKPLPDKPRVPDAMVSAGQGPPPLGGPPSDKDTASDRERK